MSNEVKEIGLRLQGLRESLDISPEEFAKTCDISLDKYLSYEDGTGEMSISELHSIAKRYHMDINTLVFDAEPRMDTYFLTRKGKGQVARRVDCYKYQTLAGGFHNKKAEVFEVTVAPQAEKLHLSSHTGQEFIHIIEGRMLFNMDGKDLTLETGDSIYFNPSLAHGMKALDDKIVRFISVILL